MVARKSKTAEKPSILNRIKNNFKYFSLILAIL